MKIAALAILVFYTLGARAEPEPCIPAALMRVGEISYMGPANIVIDRLGAPIKTKAFKYKTSGNSGTYRLKMLVYEGATFTVRDSIASESFVESWTLTAPQYSMGGKIHVGLHKTEVGAILGIHSDLDVPSLKEARLIYAGKQPKISSKKSNWALASCALHEETTFVEFHFNNTQHLSKIIVLHDDGAI